MEERTRLSYRSLDIACRDTYNLRPHGTRNLRTRERRQRPVIRKRQGRPDSRTARLRSPSPIRSCIVLTQTPRRRVSANFQERTLEGKGTTPAFFLQISRNSPPFKKKGSVIRHFVRQNCEVCHLNTIAHQHIICKALFFGIKTGSR